MAGASSAARNAARIGCDDSWPGRAGVPMRCESSRRDEPRIRVVLPDAVARDCSASVETSRVSEVWICKRDAITLVWRYQATLSHTVGSRTCAANALNAWRRAGEVRTRPDTASRKPWPSSALAARSARSGCRGDREPDPPRAAGEVSSAAINLEAAVSAAPLRWATQEEVQRADQARDRRSSSEEAWRRCTGADHRSHVPCLSRRGRDRAFSTRPDRPWDDQLLPTLGTAR
jgi:hypothetical protein